MPVVSLTAAIDTIVKASAILGATALLAAALRRAAASVRHLVWTLGLISALAVPALSAVTPRWELPLVRVPAAASLPATAPSLPAAASSWLPPSAAATVLPPEGGSYKGRGSYKSQRAESSPIAWTTVLFLVWATGAAIVIGRMLIGLAAIQWLAHRTPAITDAPWLAQARSIAGQLGVARVRFRRAIAQSMPMACGAFRPAVLMPADADTWPAHRLRVVLVHELAHVKRRDCLTHLLAQVACAAYWFNPLAWMAARRLRTERERACDDLVLASGTRGSEYADQLLEIARVMRAGRFPAVFSGASLAMAQRSQLEGRLMAILDPSVPRGGLSRARAAVASVLFALLIVPVAAVQPWTEQAAAKPDPIAPLQTPQPDKSEPARPQAAAVDPPQTPRTPKRTQDVPHTTIVDDVVGAVVGGVSGGIADGIVGGVAGGVAGGIAGGVAGGVGRGIGIGLGNGIGHGVEHEVAIEGTPQQETAAAKRSDRGRTVDPRTVNALIEAMKDTDKGVREMALQALVQLRDPRVFDPLVAALKDASADVREQAVFGLGQLRDTRAIDALGPLLHDASADVREQVAFALGQIRDRRAIEPLISALKDEKPDVRQQAAFA
ncbi:MAG TPA: M56 family metallopeptidase, partial [Vicinamibacterales bacterium]|nr:M56 family metallopeptidase [Vicinamibacterales bacterium]